MFILLMKHKKYTKRKYKSKNTKRKYKNTKKKYKRKKSKKINKRKVKNKKLKYKRLTRLGKKWVEQMEIYMKSIK